jgi:hypothetical protein
MKLTEVKKIDEMAKPANICPMCGNASVGFHTYRNGEWKCKGSVTPKPGYPLPGATYMRATSKGSPAPTAGSSSSVPSSPSAAASSSPPEEKESGSTLKDLLGTNPEAKSPDEMANKLTSMNRIPGADPIEPEDIDGESGEAPTHKLDNKQKQEIVSWLKERGEVDPSAVSFTSDSKINIDGNIDITWRTADLTKSGIYFNEVTGDFSMSVSRLTTMAGFPEKVGTGEFKGDLFVTVQQFTNLKGGPKWVGGTYNVASNKFLTSLEGIAEYIGQDLIIRECDGKGSDGKSVGTGLTSLENIHKMCKHIGGMLDAEKTSISSNVLGLLKIKGLTKVKLDNKKVEEILNKYLKGEAGNMFDCQEELVDAGLEAFADF